MRRSFLLFLLSGLSLAAFPRTKAASLPVFGDQVTLARMGTNSLIVGEVREAVRLKAKISELRNHPIPAERFADWGNKMGGKTISALIRAHLFEIALDERRIERTVKSDAIILSRYNEILKRDAKTVEELFRLFGPQREIFSKQFARESRAEAFYCTFPDYTITPKAITNALRAAQWRVAGIRQINIQAREKGRKAWERLNKGELWETVAEDVSEDDQIDEANGENFYREWEEFSAKEFPSEEMAAAVLVLQPGQFTKPIETDEGLFIVKLVEKKDGLYKCVRIGFQLAIEEDVPSVERIAADLRMKIILKIQKEAIKPVEERIKIEYPQGKKVRFYLFGQQSKNSALSGK